MNSYTCMTHAIHQCLWACFQMIEVKLLSSYASQLLLITDPCICGSVHIRYIESAFQVY